MGINNKRTKRDVYSFLVFIWLMSLLFSIVLYSSSIAMEKEYYTIQVGSFKYRSNAEKFYKILLKNLKDPVLYLLRIELINGYYVVRLGRFVKRADSGPLHSFVKGIFHDAVILSAHIKDKNIIKMAGRAKNIHSDDPKRANIDKQAQKSLREIKNISRNDPKKDIKVPRYDPRQVSLIKARILSRKGLYRDSLKVYKWLRIKYPKDTEIWNDYIETLINNSDYELALDEVNSLLKSYPLDIRGIRLKARIFQELGRYDWSCHLFEDILQREGRNSGLWSDYGYACEYEGRWSDALRAFCRVLEIDPENRYVLRSVHQILREHRPRVEISFKSYRQPEDTLTDTLYLYYRRHLTERCFLAIIHKRISIERPSLAWSPSIDYSLHDTEMFLQFQPYRRWQGECGIGIYSGLGNGVPSMIRISYKPVKRSHLHAKYSRRQPWYDPVDAARYDGYYNKASLSFDWHFQDKWGLYFATELRNYFIKDSKLYGKKKEFTGILTRKLLERPNLIVGYSFYRALFDYKDDANTQILMLKSEGVHSLSFRVEHNLSNYILVSLSAGIRRHVIRDIKSYYIFPGIKVRIGNRIETFFDYEYSSESSIAVEGKTQTLNIRLRGIF